MLPRADMTGTRPLGLIDAPTPTSGIADARQESFNRFAQIAIGKQFQVDILSRLNDGSFLVKIADTVARMNLPNGTAVGDSITATLVSADPKPTFQVGPQTSRSTVSLSSTGQLVDRFAQMAPEESISPPTGKSLPPNVAASVVAKLPEEALNASMTANLPGKAAVDGLAAGKAGPEGAVARAGLEPAVGRTGLEGVGAKTAITPGVGAATTAAPPPPNSAPTQLSSTGRLINSILLTAQQSGAPTALIGKGPLVFSPSAAPPQIATALQNAIVSSGLFYESHVAQWVNGERPVADLLREPQSKPGHVLVINSPATSSALSTSNAQGAQAAASASAAPQPSQATPQGSQAAPTQAQTQAEDVTMPQLANSPRDALPQAIGAKPAEAESVNLANSLSQDATRMINLQLNTLENQRVLWRGELWPGQPMEWEVNQDAPQRGGEQAPSSWSSTVRFELPGLGKVAANIQLVGQHVNVQIRAASDTTATALRAHRAELASALDAAGSPLDSLLVKQDGTI
jgi:hypothetical protein